MQNKWLCNSQNQFVKTDLTLYPNPVSGTLYISDLNQKVEKVQIYNVLGVLVKTSQKGNERVIREFSVEHYVSSFEMFFDGGASK